MTTPVLSFAARLERARAGATHEVREAVLDGLRSSPRTLPPWLFYDRMGAWLFERICELDEYYLTRAELEILAVRAPEIATLIGPSCAFIEYSSGAGRKIRFLLDAAERPAAYLPVDISREQLKRVAAQIAAAYPDIRVAPVCADYAARLRIPPMRRATRRVAFFPGSTIGNFHPPEAIAFLQRVRHAIGATGALILGVDRRKPAAILDAAYNDATGVTAAFNMNLLARLNRELHATFHPWRFRHRAFFNHEASRVEMHLESTTDQVVYVADEPIGFERGETIRTECSYKYDRERLVELVGAAGFAIERLWSDADDRFWVAFLTVATD